MLLDQTARLRALASSQEQRAVAAERAAEARREQATEAIDAAKRAVLAADKLHVQMLDEQARTGAWYRSPVLWFAVGAAIGAGGVAALAVAVHR